MIYFRQRRIRIESREQVEKLLNQSTTKVSSMFDLTSTSMYVILEERPFVGQKLNNEETIISRYRHSLFKVVPRIITNWKIESRGGELFLHSKNRLGLLPTTALLMILLPLLVAIKNSVLNFELPDQEAVTYSLVFSGLFIVLTIYELGQTDKAFRKVINNQKVKSLITI